MTSGCWRVSRSHGALLQGALERCALPFWKDGVKKEIEVMDPRGQGGKEGREGRARGIRAKVVRLEVQREVSQFRAMVFNQGKFPTSSPLPRREYLAVPRGSLVVSDRDGGSTGISPVKS